MNDHGRVFPFFVDGKQFKSEQEVITGAEIKTKAAVPPTYQLFLEEEGDTPDRLIADTEHITLGGKVKRFVAVPPATFGDQ